MYNKILVAMQIKAQNDKSILNNESDLTLLNLCGLKPMGDSDIKRAKVLVGNFEKNP